jgi:integrase
VAVAKKVLKDGRTRYYVVRYIDGKHVWMPGGYATKRDAVNADAALTHDRSKGKDIAPKRDTVADIVEAWMTAKRTAGKQRAVTQDLYRVVLRSRVPDVFMAKRASDVKADDVRGVLAALKDRDLASASIVKTLGILSAAFRQAVHDGKLAANPCDAVDRATVYRRELHVPSGDQVARILSTTAGHPLHAPLVVIAYTGLRRGEVLGLAWDDVDFDAATLHVRRGVTQRGQEVIFDRPKTPRATRKVPLAPSVVEVLREQRREQATRRLAVGPGWCDPLADAGGLVFDNGDGSPMHPSRLTLYFRRVVTRLGMRGTRVHDLRHFAGTTAVLAGEPVVVVSRMLGRSRVQTTQDLYVEVDHEDEREASHAIAAAIPWGG